MRLYLYPAGWNMNFNQAMLLSGIMHLALIMLLPGFRVDQLASKPYIEVSLLSPPPVVKLKKRTPPHPPAAARKKTKPVKWQALAPRLAVSSQQHKTKAYLPPVKLPAAVFEKQDVINLLPEAAFPIDELLKVPVVDQSLPQISNQVTAGGAETSPEATTEEINWAGAPRRYLYKPKSPSYSSGIEGEVRLKFWVDHQGNVTNAIVLRRLDAQLERLAIDYLKGWRFEPLKGKERELQWGTINIKFSWSAADTPGDGSHLN